MDILTKIENHIREFNQSKDETYTIDTIRVEFSKQHKLEHLRELGEWKKIPKSSNILHKLKKRLSDQEITSAYRLEKHNIYYYNTNADAPKYRKAIMVIFGMHQYHRSPPPRHLIAHTLSILKNISNIDLAIDITRKPNFQALQQHYHLTPYITKSGKPSSQYINSPDIPMIQSIVFYDKAYKNNLPGILWRIEATITIPSIKYLALPLYEFQEIVNIARN